MTTRKNDGPVEVKDDEPKTTAPTPEAKEPEAKEPPAPEQTSADAAAAFEEAIEDDAPTRKRRTTQTTDHRERAAAKVAGPATRRTPAEITWVRLKLHNNKEIPPGGLHVGVNGKSIKIPPNEWVEIPDNFLAVLDDAVRSEPVRNENNQVVDYRDVPRFPYTLDRKYKG